MDWRDDASPVPIRHNIIGNNADNMDNMDNVIENVQVVTILYIVQYL